MKVMTFDSKSCRFWTLTLQGLYVIRLRGEGVASWVMGGLYQMAPLNG